MSTTMADNYPLDKTIDALQKSVEANQSSAAANTKNAEATQSLQALAGDQIILSKSLTLCNCFESCNDSIQVTAHLVY